jgi:hypothetical protein
VDFPVFRLVLCRRLVSIGRVKSAFIDFTAVPSFETARGYPDECVRRTVPAWAFRYLRGKHIGTGLAQANILVSLDPQQARPKPLGQFGSLRLCPTVLVCTWVARRPLPASWRPKM